MPKLLQVKKIKYLEKVMLKSLKMMQQWVEKAKKNNI